MHWKWVFFFLVSGRGRPPQFSRLPYKSNFFFRKKMQQRDLTCLSCELWLTAVEWFGAGIWFWKRVTTTNVANSGLLDLDWLAGEGGDPSTRIWHFGRRKTLAEMTKGCKSWAKSDSLLFPKNTTNLIGAMPNRAPKAYWHKAREDQIFPSVFLNLKFKAAGEKLFCWKSHFSRQRKRGDE